MAIVQISRITQRKGLQINLPQLAGAELGWSIDSRRLFIGNGTLEEGAPVIGNTEVLTEFSDILALADLYTYKGLAAGYAAQTGPTIGSPITQSLQSWLDQFATVKDFGAVGDGVADDTAAINRAIFQIYCRETNPQIRRSLFFPAGVYKVSDTIVIPPYATLYGEGADNSVINFEVLAWTNTISYNQGTLVSFSGNYYRALAEVPTGIAITNALYWDPTVLPTVVACTGDSLQQTGADIGTNGATPPRYIAIQNMGFSSSAQGLDIMLVEDAENCDFYNVKFAGPLTTAQLNTDSNPTSCLVMASTPSLITSKINFENCLFTGCTYALNCDEQVASTVISESRFETLYKGVLLGTGTPINGGPTGIRIVHNSFDSIYEQGVIFGDVSLNATGYNIFYDVGNHFGGILQPYTSIISIQKENNISVADMFAREDSYATTYPRVEILDNVASIATTNGRDIQMGAFTRQSGFEQQLSDNISSATTIFTSTQSALSVNYSITRNTARRVGVLTITNIDGVGLSWNDDYTQNVDTGVTLTVTQTGGAVSVRYTSSSTGFDPYFYYSIFTTI